MKNRLLKHTRTNISALGANAAHQFAASHALKIYQSNSIYSFIPKNACSSLRTSLAIANRCIRDASQFNWIHANNDTFRATLEDLIVADYTFVILRDPFARLASVYLDKIAGKREPAWALHKVMAHEIELESITFAGFVGVLAKDNNKSSDIHWRPQADFLVYEEYDDYFALENFAAAASIIDRKARLPIIDARPLTQHGLDHYELLAPHLDFSMVPAFEIRRLQQDGKCPHPRSLYTERTIDTVTQLYAADLRLYADRIGRETLFS